MNGQENETMDLARWSGLGMLLEVGGMDKCLEHFAKLVAAKERNEILDSFSPEEPIENWIDKILARSEA